jgi:hypothetical protein
LNFEQVLSWDKFLGDLGKRYFVCGVDMNNWWPRVECDGQACGVTFTSLLVHSLA